MKPICFSNNGNYRLEELNLTCVLQYLISHFQHRLTWTNNYIARRQYFELNLHLNLFDLLYTLLSRGWRFIIRSEITIQCHCFSSFTTSYKISNSLLSSKVASTPCIQTYWEGTAKAHLTSDGYNSQKITNQFSSLTDFRSINEYKEYKEIEVVKFSTSIDYKRVQGYLCAMYNT
jgi:hypothetical protein